jgi:hypothetical protein
LQVVRNSQKVIAKDMTSISTAVKALAAACGKETPAAAAAGDKSAAGSEKAKLQTAKALATLIKDVTALKKKVCDDNTLAASFLDWLTQCCSWLLCAAGRI